MKSPVRLVSLLLSAVLLASGCSVLNAENIPVSTGVEDPYDVTVFFPDALNLANGAAVKIDGATVGRVEEITTENFEAKVLLNMDGKTKLPSDTVFRLRPTTALGELFVEVIRGDRKKLLTSGAVVQSAQTRTAPTVEDGLAAASLLINGGSLSQIKTIVAEVNTALDGRKGTVKDFINNSGSLIHTLNASKADIDEFLSSLARTSTLLNEREGKINRAIRLVGPVSEVIRRNSGEVTELLQELQGMSENVDALVSATKGDVTATAEEIGPVLDTLSTNSTQAKAMLIKATRLSGLIDRAVPTEYLNLSLVLRLSADFGLPRSAARTGVVR
ncbi:MCE family protein [Nocardioides sp. JQ2195]|uniref:MCE family protein n=1 Tax=Nocardioides sp. JQ2195 TaxID=2592334 RepID=UPI00143E13AE|nr:MCE family protein [Nocardioides sp. JQ2195]QIX26609.1 MCE family protein [Nocardioides sp. JQ2195]